MLFLLRKIRRKLISPDNKVITYLLYAIGEIFLVVIGILIAVSIDNWNEQRKLDQKAENLLVQIQDEALLDIAAIDERMRGFIFKDSLYEIVTADTMSFDNYLKPESFGLRVLTYQWSTFSQHKKGYQAFMDQIDQFSPRFRALAEPLSSTFIAYEAGSTIVEKQLMEGIERQYAFSRSQPWHGSVFETYPEKIHPGFINYLQNDFRYKNEARSYGSNIRNMANLHLGLKNNLVDLYKLINLNLTEPEELPNVIKDYYVSLTNNEKQALTGLYLNDKKETLEVTLVNNDLYVQFDNQKLKLSSINQKRLLINLGGFAVTCTYNTAENKFCYQVLYQQDCYYKK